MKQLHKCPLCGAQRLRVLKPYTAHHLAKCRSCGFVFSNITPTPEELNALYHEYFYGVNNFVSPITLERYRAVVKGFERYRKNNRLLDVGCGNGQLLSVARDTGWECYGLDVSQMAVQLCHEQGFTVFEGTLATVEKRIPECDVVVSVEVLEHLNTPVEELQQMHRLLRPGGLLYLTTPNFNGLLRLLTRKDYAIIDFPEHLCYFTPRTLRQLARRCGFKVARMQSTGFSVSGLKGLIKSRFNNPAHPLSTDERLRHATESNLIMKGFKRFTNSILSATGTGNTLKVWLIKS